ncbi:TPA: DUF4926 domain-containing protein [Pseudomonas aeruginosa]|mgnify:CR=1 FL=1|jgi:hypothetical protein|uniref:DUF4926 domain-containing protein n=1 Tax=Pseudomonadaceae TaxID=135621 RepID=UPI0009DAA0CA|nr:DUF4926 domain-containing protein [Pseudomonas aeruginosa]MBU8395013.1 DUF4926 domain-containing protein [Pseudomonas aeruginosa]RPM87983.1 DUF4926 domain-containing protein [Pseudomonas aeruginosa]RPR98063.1 DUF4926 domain-containing protein [Pseudomonas aeruginosa]RUA96170.1 DUF4926 domain-containing protein [Pseudomonas aeruginosa]
MSLEINEVVRLLEDIPSEGLCSGSLGVIVAVFSEPEEAYEVEFCDEEGVTVAQLALRSSQFEVVK